MQSGKVVLENQRLVGQGKTNALRDEEIRVKDQERGERREEFTQTYLCRHQFLLTSSDDHNYCQA